MLDDRKMRVLYAIIDCYIKSAEPIGSRTITKQYDLGVSSATVRNEMSDLEELGLLNKPHSSAGRVPSDIAYRLYVDHILKIGIPNFDDITKRNIKKILVNESFVMEQLIKNAAKVLSEITNYTAIAISPRLENSRIKHVHLTSIGNNQVLLVVIYESDIVKDMIFRLDETLNDEHIQTISNFLNRKLKDHYLEDISSVIDAGILEELYDYSKILDKLIPIINNSLECKDSVDLYSEGITRILTFPEYKNIDKAKSLISLLEDKNILIDILSNKNLDSDNLNIIIGNENFHEELKDSSLITATYALNGKTIGKIGIIGPTRMEYQKLISTLKLFSTNINEIIDSLMGNR